MCEIGCIFSFYGIITLIFDNACISRIEFDKNANSTLICNMVRLRPISHSVSLATIGVCVFCASASVGALFVF